MKCRVKKCDKTSIRRGWCSPHYRRWLRHGRPTAGGTPKGAALKFIEQAKTYRGEECLLWPFGTNGRRGYAVLTIEHRTRLVHRIICEAENGLPPSSLHEAAHSCGNGHLGCITSKHLSWKTHADNQTDKIAHGTSMRGDLAPSSKLTEQEAIEIRALKGIKSQHEIAVRYGVTQPTVGKIHRRETWRHV